MEEHFAIESYELNFKSARTINVPAGTFIVLTWG
jgi:hypothetical protein